MRQLIFLILILINLLSVFCCSSCNTRECHDRILAEKKELPFIAFAVSAEFGEQCKGSRHFRHCSEVHEFNTEDFEICLGDLKSCIIDISNNSRIWVQGKLDYFANRRELLSNTSNILNQTQNWFERKILTKSKQEDYIKELRDRIDKELSIKSDLQQKRLIIEDSIKRFEIERDQYQSEQLKKYIEKEEQRRRESFGQIIFDSSEDINHHSKNQDNYEIIATEGKNKNIQENTFSDIQNIVLI